MTDVTKTRRGLAASAAVAIACILLLLYVTSPRWSLRPGSTPPAGQQQAAATRPDTPADQAGAPGPMPAPDAAGTAPSSPESSKRAEAPALPAGQTKTASAPAMAVPNPGQPSATGAAPAGDTASQTGNTSGDQPKPVSAADNTTPRFDIVRIEPTGDSVVAARAAPNSQIVLLDGGTAIASATADDNGQVALLPPPLKPGEHSLVLSVTTKDGSRTQSSQSIAVSVPDRPKTAPMVAMIQPNEPASILSGPVAGGAPEAAAPAASGAGKPETLAAAALAIQSVEVEDAGSFYATGKALPGSKSRIYLNGSFVATVTADQFGLWSLKIQRGMKPGRYAVRADQIDAKSGRVAQRAEVPFDYPQLAATSLRKGLKTADNAEPQAASSTQPGSGAAKPGKATPAGKSAAAPSSAQPKAAATPSPPQVGGSAASGGAGGAPPAMGAVADAADDRKATPASTSGPGPASGADSKGAADAPGAPSGAGSASPLPAKGSSSTAAQDAGDMKAGTAGDVAANANSGATPGGAAPAGDTGGVASGTAGSAGVPAKPAAPETMAAPAEQAKSAAPPKPDDTAVASAEQPSGSAQQPAGAAPSDAGAAGQSPPSGGDTKAAGAGSGRLASSEIVTPRRASITTIVPELVTAKVIRGDSLWRISRKMLGHGIRYTQIYAANTKQIRDPSLIYPGQVLVVPQDETR